MLAGHYGIGLLLKRQQPALPLWKLFLAVELVDAFWALFVLLDSEHLRIVPGITRTNPLDLYYMPYTHSLTSTVVWSAAAYTAYRLVSPNQKKRPALFIAIAVASHWWADLLVHRPDLPLYGDTNKVGLGLWHYPGPAFLLEAALVGFGFLRCLRLPQFAVKYGRLTALCGGLVLVQGIVSFGYEVTSPDVASAFVLCFIGILILFARLIEPTQS